MPSTRPVRLEAAYPQPLASFACAPAVSEAIERKLSAASASDLPRILDLVARHIGARMIVLWRQDIAHPAVGVASAADRPLAEAHSKLMTRSFKPLSMDARITAGNALLLPDGLAAASLVQTGIPLETGLSVSIAIASTREAFKINAPLVRLAIAIASRMGSRKRTRSPEDPARCLEILDRLDLDAGVAQLPPDDFVTLDAACAARGAASFRHLRVLLRQDLRFEKMRARQADRARLAARSSPRPSQTSPAPVASNTTTSRPAGSVATIRREPSRSI